MKFPLPLLALPALSSALPQTTSTPPPSFRITSVISGGTGCPRGSIDVKWTDTKILPIKFGPEFIAAVGPKADITDSRKNCQLNLKLEYDAGYSFAVYSAEYTGFAELEAGVQGSVKSTYYFSGAGEQASTSLALSGPTKLRFKKQDDVPVALWSPCSGDALFNVNAEVALTPLASAASGVLGITKETGRLSSNLYFQWKKC